jgi:hypothetical protein
MEVKSSHLSFPLTNTHLMGSKFYNWAWTRLRMNAKRSHPSSAYSAQSVAIPFHSIPSAAVMLRCSALKQLTLCARQRGIYSCWCRFLLGVYVQWRSQVISGDSFADDTFIRDQESGIFFDPEKLHVLNHKGDDSKVKGPLNIARPIQGWPVIVQAGQSEPGRQLAAKTAEVVFCSPRDLESAMAL